MPKKVLHLGMAVIVVSTFIITYGNWLGKEEKTPEPPEKTTQALLPTDMGVGKGKRTGAQSFSEGLASAMARIQSPFSTDMKG